MITKFRFMIMAKAKLVTIIVLLYRPDNRIVITVVNYYYKMFIIYATGFIITILP
jgi:hypothetical protein